MNQFFKASCKKWYKNYKREPGLTLTVTYIMTFIIAMLGFCLVLFALYNPFAFVISVIAFIVFVLICILIQHILYDVGKKEYDTIYDVGEKQYDTEL